MKHKDRPHDLSSVLKSSLANLNIPECLTHARIVREWPRCVGDQVARRAHPERLDGTTLHCTVSSAPWMSELTYQKRSVIQKINAVVGPGTVTDIRFKTGVVPEPTEPPAEGQSSARVDASTAGEAHIAPSKERREFIEELVSGVKDEELRETIRRAMERSGSDD